MKKNVIYLNDWLAIHPYTTICSSDTFFVELANKLYAACHLEELPDDVSQVFKFVCGSLSGRHHFRPGIVAGIYHCSYPFVWQVSSILTHGKRLYKGRGKLGGYTLYHLEYMAEGSFLTRVCENRWIPQS